MNRLRIAGRRIALSMLAASMLAAPSLAMGRQAPQEAAILVTGQLPVPPGAIAYGMETLDEAALRREPSGRLENALTGLAGVQQFRRADSRSANPSAQGITLRALGGNAASRALVLLDGVPQADPFFGSVPFRLLDGEPLARARIIRGGGAGAFGAGALAGTIALETAMPGALPAGAVGLRTGSAGALEAEGLIAPDLGGASLRLGGRFERGDGFFTAPAGQRGPADVAARYQSWSASLGASLPMAGAAVVQARMAIARDARTLRFAGADSRTASQDASLRYLSSGRWRIDALAYLQWRDFRNVVVSATSFRPVLDQYRTPTTGVGAKLELRAPPMGEHQFRFGLDFRHAAGQAQELALSATSGLATARRMAGGAQTLIGGFVEEDWRHGALTLTAGVRIDRWRQSDGRFVERTPAGALVSARVFAVRHGWEGSLRGGGRWQVAPGFALRATGYTGFRLPTLNELYRGFTLFPVTTQANAALNPERLRGAELGLEASLPGEARLAATFFVNRLSSAIANVTIGPNLRQRRNLSAIVARGIEAHGAARMGPMILAGSWAWSRSRVRDGAAPGLDGARPAQSPEHSASLALDWALSPRARLGMLARYLGLQAEDDLGVDRLPEALTLGASGQWPLTRHVALVASAENLLDARIVTRKVGESSELGAPRTFWLGLRLVAPRRIGK